jgi:drug/metabolite transporter (DMT)-like permease
MSNPLDTIAFDQSPAYMPIRFAYGDDLSISITFPFAITDYDFTATVLDSFGNTVTALTCTKSTAYILIVSCLAEITATFSANYTYTIAWDNTSKRTFLTGPLENTVNG